MHPSRTVMLRRVGRRTAERLWSFGQNDEAWPLRDPGRAGWQRMVESLWAAEVVRTGAIRAAWSTDGMLLGFVSCSLLPEDWMGEPVRAMECGTYLVPNARGRGWNGPVKLALMDFVFCNWPVDWCVFTVSTRNQAALRAFAKLPWPAAKAESDDGIHTGRIPAQTTDTRIRDKAAEPIWLRRLCRRKAWETGEDCVVFAIERRVFEGVQRGAI